MGCFNYTCGYSNIHISCGDKVKLFFLVPNGSYHGCKFYTQDQFTVLAPGIDATYNDYGWFEFDESNEITENIQKRISEMFKKPEGKMYDREGWFKTYEEGDLIPWNVIGSAIHYGELQIHDTLYGAKTTPLFLEMIAIHSELVDDIISSSVYYNTTFSKISGILAAKTAVLNVIKEIRDKVQTLTNDKKSTDILISRDELYLKWDMDSKFDLNKILDHSCLNHKSVYTVHNLSSDAVSLSKAIAELLTIDSIMDQENLMWLPQRTAGQEYEYDYEQVRAERLLKFVNKLKAARDAENEDLDY